MREIGSGSLLCEPVECQPGGVLPGQNHSLDCYGTWQITSQRNSGVDKDIGVSNSGAVMRRVSTACARMMRINAGRRSKTISSTEFHKVGRNRLTRTVDITLELIRRFLPPIHWVAVRFLALLLYGYARAVRATSENRVGGEL